MASNGFNLIRIQIKCQRLLRMLLVIRFQDQDHTWWKDLNFSSEMFLDIGYWSKMLDWQFFYLKTSSMYKVFMIKIRSDEKFQTFHQMWSWSWRLCTRSCFEIKKNCQSNILLQYPISKNISEEKVNSFHQVWSWSWKRITSRILSNLWNIIPMCMLGIGGLPLKIMTDLTFHAVNRLRFNPFLANQGLFTPEDQ